MMSTIKKIINPFMRKYVRRKIPIHWVKKDGDSWLSQTFNMDSYKPRESVYSNQIETLAYNTNKLGAQPLWKGYEGNNVGGSTRIPDGVRTSPDIGNLYTFLVQELKPRIIVEFGTAFGVSGMYFLAGIRSNKVGKLLTFEPNDVWAGFAKNNLSMISDRFELTIGTFEDKIDIILQQEKKIDLAFIDAIHTKEFVIPQLEMVIDRSHKKTIIILDDINFSDDMKDCWKEISYDNRFSASAEFGERVGILELK